MQICEQSDGIYTCPRDLKANDKFLFLQFFQDFFSFSLIKISLSMDKKWKHKC